jgi:hypothetical protein
LEAGMRFCAWRSCSTADNTASHLSITTPGKIPLTEISTALQQGLRLRGLVCEIRTQPERRWGAATTTPECIREQSAHFIVL